MQLRSTHNANQCSDEARGLGVHWALGEERPVAQRCNVRPRATRAAHNTAGASAGPLHCLPCAPRRQPTALAARRRRRCNIGGTRRTAGVSALLCRTPRAQPPEAGRRRRSLVPPIVDSWYSKNCPLTKRRTSDDLPTAESPSKTNLNWNTFGAAAMPALCATCLLLRAKIPPRASPRAANTAELFLRLVHSGHACDAVEHEAMHEAGGDAGRGKGRTVDLTR